MHCPDCGHFLTPVPLGITGEVNQSFRCYRCGGFWVEGWLVNRITTKMLDKWPQTGLAHGFGDGGSGECPVHFGNKLERYTGDSVPQDMHVLKCRLCGWWWFPHNTLFSFKPAQEAKVNYYRLWGMPADLKGMLLPLIALLVLIGGGIVAAQLVKQHQYALLNASGVISNVSFTYVGNGEAVISFVSQIKISSIEFRKAGDVDWIMVDVTSVNGLYTITNTNLEEQQQYEFKILGVVYTFVTQ